MNRSRRQILTAWGAALVLPGVTRLLKAASRDEAGQPHIATNTYPWLTFARRAKREFKLHTDELLGDIARANLVGYEPIITNPNEFTMLAGRLEAHGLEMRSIYVNSVLHEADQVDASIADVVRIATESKKLGTRIVVTNPSPIRWGGPEDKTDSQLRLQARSLDSLGAQLRKQGLTLAYHNHDAELRQGGREFHHMLTATDPDNVKFCLDAHWIYRGCGNSEVAVFDALTNYHERIVELHLRQSSGGVWTESFAMQGDIDYQRLFDFLEQKQIAPHFVLEQAVESESRQTTTVVEAHRAGHRNLKKGLA